MVTVAEENAFITCRREKLKFSIIHINKISKNESLITLVVVISYQGILLLRMFLVWIVKNPLQQLQLNPINLRHS